MSYVCDARKAWPGTLVDPYLLSGQKHRCIAIYIWDYSIYGMRKFLED
jgi:hypothetical protein